MKQTIETTLKEYLQRTHKPYEPIYIGITGYGRSGKDTVARLLADTLSKSHEVVIESLADSLKHGLSELIDRPGDFQTDRKENKAPFFGDATYRDVMISFGDWARSFNEDIFVDLLKDSPYIHEEDIVIVPDIRRMNEVRHMDFLIRVTRPGVGPAADHPTEGELDGYPEDFLIENDGSLEALREKVAEIL
jgi:dephospho-CoA kinase